jgi:cell division protein FtsN
MFFGERASPIRDIRSLHVMFSPTSIRASVTLALGGHIIMARRNDLSQTSRIFSRKPSRTSRVLSALLLSLSLLVTLAGLGTAIYLERARDSATTPSPLAAELPSGGAAPIVPAAMVATNEPHDPMAAAAAIPVPPPTPPSIEPSAGTAATPASPARRIESPERHQGGTSSPPSVSPSPQIARLEVTPQPAPRAVTVSPAAPTTAIETREPATPTNTAPATSYWVEYGVYTNTRAAKRLQQALADQGLETVIAPTHTPDGRPLLRVRSAPALDYGAAKAASENARQALKLSALVHRGTPAPDQPVAQPTVSQAPASSAPQGYWVQFGAFPYRAQAVRLQEQLARSGIDTAVSTMRGTSGRTLYWVRSLNLPDRDSAVAVATRGQQAGSTDFLVGQSIARPGSAAEPNRTEDESLRQVPRYHAAESLPFPAR